MIIYADEVFIKNFVMTYLILLIVGEILNLKYKKRNLMLGSVVASLITLIAIIYKIDNNFLTRVLTILTMSKMSFKTKESKDFLVICTFILLVTFLIGGVITSNINNILEIIICGTISIIAIKKYIEYYKKKKWNIRNQYKLSFNIENNLIELNAFLDTGNFLTSNLKDESVIIISKEALKDKVPFEIVNLLLNGEIGNLKFNILKNIRPINYGVLNEETKFAYGLKVKNIKIKSENCEIVRDAVIILSKNKIKESEAIIGISLLEGGIESGDIMDVKTKSKEIIC